mmetsp:Transcript_62210/g.196876  ORF Transcript_62210/g.196876 Transcript_62210/m.196876 type:complete len:362 (-) Transcript_62210:341-1426(-)
MCASTASCSASAAALVTRRSVAGPLVRISRMRRWKGALGMSSSEVFWYLRISRRALVPCFTRRTARLTPSGTAVSLGFLPLNPTAALNLLWASAMLPRFFRGAMPPVDLRAVCLVRAIVQGASEPGQVLQAARPRRRKKAPHGQGRGECDPPLLCCSDASSPRLQQIKMLLPLPAEGEHDGRPGVRRAPLVEGSPWGGEKPRCGGAVLRVPCGHAGAARCWKAAVCGPRHASVRVVLEGGVAASMARQLGRVRGGHTRHPRRDGAALPRGLSDEPREVHLLRPCHCRHQLQSYGGPHRPGRDQAADVHHPQLHPLQPEPRLQAEALQRAGIQHRGLLHDNRAGDLPLPRPGGRGVNPGPRP